MAHWIDWIKRHWATLIIGAVLALHAGFVLQAIFYPESYSRWLAADVSLTLMFLVAAILMEYTLHLQAQSRKELEEKRKRIEEAHQHFNSNAGDGSSHNGGE